MLITDDELELGILKRFVAQHKTAAMLEQQDKCARELDMRAVIQELTGLEGKELDYETGRWYEKLAQGRNAALRFCTDNTRNKGDHRYHARAFRMRGTEPAWERIRELEAVFALSRPSTPERELEQKFRILWSPGQALADFTRWIDSGSVQHSGVGVLFIDIDDFKSLNTQFTEVRVDRDLLVPFQVLLDRLTIYRGHAYK